MFPLIFRHHGNTLFDRNDPIMREFGRLVGRCWNDWNSSDCVLAGAYPVDIKEDVDNVYVSAELPGFGRDQISITLEENVLHIEAERKDPEHRGLIHLAERQITSVSRSFAMPVGVDASKVKTELNDGVLSLTFPKTEKVEPRKIDLN